METTKKSTRQAEKESDRLINPYKELVQTGAISDSMVSQILTAILFNWNNTEAE